MVGFVLKFGFLSTPSSICKTAYTGSIPVVASTLLRTNRAESLA